MNISLLQLDVQWMKPETNIARAELLAEEADGTDVLLLPEMWATGFTTRPDAAVHEASMQALCWMRQTSKERNCVVAGTLAVMDDGTATEAESCPVWRNRFFFIKPCGETVCYDKRHLFVPGGEEKNFSAGEHRVVAEYKGVRFLLQTCFDLRFPESARNVLSDPYDVVLYAACWPKKRIAAWNALLRARAVENQALCIGVNRTGEGGQAVYCGMSGAYDAEGLCLASLGEAPLVQTVAFNKEKQDALRMSFPVLV